LLDLRGLAWLARIRIEREQIILDFAALHVYVMKLVATRKLMDS
jgi:hypothetical protein